MQLTRFDRWLRKTFVYETQFYAMRCPDPLPRGIRAEVLPENPGQPYRYKLTARSEKAADRLVQAFSVNGQQYATRVSHRRVWYAPLLAPERVSVTWRLVGWLLMASAGYGLFRLLQFAWFHPTIRRTLSEALETLKG